MTAPAELIFIVSLLFSGLFSMLEAAVISQDKHRLQHLAEEGNKNAVIMRRLLARMDRLLSTLLLCNNLANIACATSATVVAARLLPHTPAALLWTTFVVTFIILVCSEITPKVIGVRHASAIALAFARVLHVLNRLLLPLTMVANFFSNCLLWLGGLSNTHSWRTVMSLKEVRSALRASLQTKDGEDDNRQAHYQLLENSLRFNELTVEKIMTPRHAIEGINLQDDIAAMRGDLEKAHRYKLLLFDGNFDRAAGVVNTVDAFKLINGNRLSADALRQLASPVIYIPAAATALQQLKNMRQQGRQFALVADGSGRVVGLLTFANFAAAIIGEETPPRFQARGDGALLLPGNTSLLQLEQLQPGANAPSDSNATTVNGIILEQLGGLPPAPLCLKINDWCLEIISMDEKSVQEVALYPATTTAADDSETDD